MIAVKITVNKTSVKSRQRTRVRRKRLSEFKKLSSVKRIPEELPEIPKTGNEVPSLVALRYSSLVDRLESEPPMMKTISTQ